ncbi:MAG: DUF4080 domain-containing protein [Gammaproteobacteria bacterium]|nr:DUF4080 domain-containing protein [Gammaproteobacteria bacterium]
MTPIILTTLNAKYIHTSLGLRYLLANMGELQDSTRIVEFTIQSRPIDIVESLLAEKPQIIGLGVYIWNVEEVTRVVALLKQISPETMIVLGGPEVSFEHDQPPIVAMADYVMTGQSEGGFAELCGQLLAGERPTEKIISPAALHPELMEMPYRLYSDEDIAHRLIYVEASRGCPFKCEFCLSALDKTVWPFNLDKFLEEMRILYDRGVRHFKFVDRTFNLKIEHSIRIMEFFLQRLDEELFLHFELIPDHLPERLKDVMVKFPEGSLQFEIGIQSFNPEVQATISRKQNNEKTAENLTWIRNSSHAHIHADLIVGLPGEGMASFARGFNQLVALNTHEIQVGILKRLRGTPIIRHSEDYDMRYNPLPPYNILSTNKIDFQTMQRLSRFARYWDMIANSGRFSHTCPVLLGEDPFARFIQFSDWLFAETGQTHRIALNRLFELLHRGLTTCLKVDADIARESLAKDFVATVNVSLPDFLMEEKSSKKVKAGKTMPRVHKPSSNSSRQSRHVKVS